MVPVGIFGKKMQRFVLLMLVLTSVKCQQSEKYLQNAIRDLRQLNVQNLRRADTTQLPSSIKKKPDPERFPHERRYNEEVHVPSLTLTKGELAAIYENAVSKGETIKLDAGDNTYIHAAVHELNDDGSKKYHEEKPSSSHDDEDGYYYYYYPIKSFLDEITAQAGTSNEYTYKPKPTRPVLTTQKPQYQFHSHHHQHNITINKAIQEEKKPSKALEPLFMAISGFIGMAVMLVFSVVFMSSKFSSKPTKHRDWSKKDNIDDLSRFALNALDGQCAERFACELSKRARNFSFQDNRFIKLLKRLAPGGFQNHIDKVGKYTKQIKCTAIPCKKNNIKNQKNQKKKNAPQKKH